MKSLANSTNGFMIISDSFTTAIFKQSFLRTFGKDAQGWLQMGFNATFDVLVSSGGLGRERVFVKVD
jgi:protein transport protein SEC23